MAAELVADRQVLVQGIKSSLQRVAAQAQGLRKTHTRLLLTSALCSALSTLVAGVTAAHGPVVGVEESGWRLACIVAAVLSSITTLSVGLSQQLQFSDRAAESDQALRRLKALDIAIAAGTRTWDEIAKEYEDLARSHPHLIG